MQGTKEGLTLFELVFTLTIIGVFIGTVSIFINKAAVIAKETALEAGLRNLRSSLVLYKALNERNPEDLRVLVNTEYGFGASGKTLFGEKFLSVVGRDTEGYPLDPFGNRFYYDQRRGVVKSVTEGYQSW